MNQVHKSPVFDSPPGPLSEIFKEGEPCHIRIYWHKSSLSRNAREVPPSRSALSAQTDGGECNSQSVTFRQTVHRSIISVLSDVRSHLPGHYCIVKIVYPVKDTDYKGNNMHQLTGGSKQ